MTQTKRQMSLSLSLQSAGYHAAAWRLDTAPANPDTDYRFYLDLALRAERAKFDMIFFADGVAIRESDIDPDGFSRHSGVGRLEPLTLVSAIAACTTHIGLGVTASTSYNEPFHVARQFASIDHISGGRACWNVVTSWTDAEAKNFNREKHFDYASRYERAREFVEVVRGLWDGWEDEALVLDKESGVYLDPDRLHVLDHRGKHFKVRGPLNIARTPQGRPLICQAGQSDVGQELAAESADIIYTIGSTFEAGRTFYRSVKDRMPRYGRHPDALKILPGIVPVVAPTKAEAEDRFAALQDLIEPALGLTLLAPYFGDLSHYPFDGPLPDEARIDTIQSVAEALRARARRENLSIRQLCRIASVGNNFVVGDPETVAGLMEDWFTGGAADGFNICSPDVPAAAQSFIDLVVPLLQERGLFRTEYQGRTLRENLGLDHPENRHARAGAPRSVA